MKKVMSVLALCGLLALSGGSAFAAQWKLAHIRPADSVIERDLQAFAKEVREQPTGASTSGSMLQPAWDYTVVQEKVSLALWNELRIRFHAGGQAFPLLYPALCRQGLRHREEELRHRNPYANTAPTCLTSRTSWSSPTGPCTSAASAL